MDFVWLKNYNALKGFLLKKKPLVCGWFEENKGDKKLINKANIWKRQANKLLPMLETISSSTSFKPTCLAFGKEHFYLANRLSKRTWKLKVYFLIRSDQIFEFADIHYVCLVSKF